MLDTVFCAELLMWLFLRFQESHTSLSNRPNQVRKDNMADPQGFEPRTLRLTGARSNHWS
ncbi:hypothetical protein VPHD479_0376 [Vibrio phage D479]